MTQPYIIMFVGESHQYWLLNYNRVGRPLRHPELHRASPATKPSKRATQCHKCHACHQVPHLPRETKEDVAKCHACHAKRRWLSPSATATTQNEGGCHQVPGLPRKLPRMCVKDGGWQRWLTKMVCERWCVKDGV